MTPQEHACAIARKFLEGNRPLVETCRSIQAPLETLGLCTDTMFVTFVGIDSEADVFPIGAERQHWNRDVLAKKDVEFARFEQFYRRHVEIACRNVLERFGHPDS